MSDRKPDVFDGLVGLEGKTVKHAAVCFPISLGVTRLRIDFMDGTSMDVTPLKYGRQQKDALGLTFTSEAS